MNDRIESVLAELDGFRMCDQMDYAAYSRLHDLICVLEDPPWVSIKDGLPEVRINPLTLDFCEVMCAVDFSFGREVRIYKFGEGHFWHGAEVMDRYITHWMYMPTLPKKEEI